RERGAGRRRYVAPLSRCVAAAGSGGGRLPPRSTLARRCPRRARASVSFSPGSRLTTLADRPSARQPTGIFNHLDPPRRKLLPSEASIQACLTSNSFPYKKIGSGPLPVPNGTSIAAVRRNEI